MNQLRSLAAQHDLQIVVPSIERPTNFIQSFRFYGMPKPYLSALVDERLPDFQFYGTAHDYEHQESLGHFTARAMAEQGVFISYMENANLFRLSIPITATKDDVDTLVRALHEVLKNKRFDTIRGSWLLRGRF